MRAPKPTPYMVLARIKWEQVEGELCTLQRVHKPTCSSSVASPSWTLMRRYGDYLPGAAFKGSMSLCEVSRKTGYCNSQPSAALGEKLGTSPSVTLISK